MVNFELCVFYHITTIKKKKQQADSCWRDSGIGRMMKTKMQGAAGNEMTG